MIERRQTLAIGVLCFNVSAGQSKECINIVCQTSSKQEQVNLISFAKR